MTALDTDTTLDVDLDKVRACDVRGCDIPAAWLAVAKCPSGHTFDLCDGHKRQSLEGLLLEVAFGTQIRCAACSAVMRDPYLEWRPL